MSHRIGVLLFFSTVLASGWPLSSAVADAAGSGLSPAPVDLLRTYLFPRHGAVARRLKKGIRTDGVLVLKHGKTVYEEYANGFTPEMPHQLWSAGKSVVNALVGIAIKEGKLKLNDSVCNFYVPPRADDGHCAITVDHLLRWSSGLNWLEVYGTSKPLKLTVLQMLYGLGEADTAGFTFGRNLSGPPGSVWAYSSGDSNLLMGILKKVYGASYETMPWSSLFDRLGMEEVSWSRDQSGTYIGSSYLFMRPRDFARIGEFFMNHGEYQGEQLLPPDWVDYSLRLAPAFALGTHQIDEPDKVSGAQWWINLAVPEHHLATPWPDAPRDTFAAIGFLGQYLFVIPSEDLIIVRTGDDLDHSFNRNEFLKRVLAVARQKP